MPPSLSHGTWNPSEVLRFVRSVPSSTNVAIVVTDAGEGYLKAIGNPAGEHALACEWVATHLARLLGLPTFDFSLIQLTDIDEIPLANGGRAKPGPAFITRAEKGEPWGGKARELKHLANVSDISRLVVFDTWTRNCDRYCPSREDGQAKTRFNYNNVFLSQEAPKGKLLLRAMDHTHCFTSGGELTRRISNIDTVRDSLVYGLFPEFWEFLSKKDVQIAADKLSGIPCDEVGNITQSIPPEWQVGPRARESLKKFVCDRASYVAEHIMDWIWDGEFEFMKGKEDEQ